MLSSFSRRPNCYITTVFTNNYYESQRSMYVSPDCVVLQCSGLTCIARELLSTKTVLELITVHVDTGIHDIHAAVC